MCAHLQGDDLIGITEDMVELEQKGADLGEIGRGDGEVVLPSLVALSDQLELHLGQMRSKQELMGVEGLGNQVTIKVSGNQQLSGLCQRSFIRHKTEILMSDPDLQFLEADKL